MSARTLPLLALILAASVACVGTTEDPLSPTADPGLDDAAPSRDEASADDAADDDAARAETSDTAAPADAPLAEAPAADAAAEVATKDAATAEAETRAAPRRVGLFVGVGAGSEYTAAVTKVLGPDSRFTLSTFTDGRVDFRTLDVVIMPGGSASAEWKALGATGQSNLKAFVSGGGGFIGVCAGFYLALSSTAGFIPATHYEPWARGEGSVEVKLAAGNAVFSLTGTHRLRYVNGPIVYPLNAKVPGYTVLATFAGNIGSSTIVSMTGKPAVVAADYGSGRVVAFSPHPELSGLGSLLKDAVLWAAR